MLRVSDFYVSLYVSAMCIHVLLSGNELWDAKNTIRRMQNDLRYLQQLTGKTALGSKIQQHISSRKNF